jgi:tryptophan halogenase
MSLPDSLVAKLDMFTRQGKLLADYYDLFRPVSWMAVLTGLGITPQRADPLADLVPRDRAQQILRGVSQAIRQTALAQPAHEAVLSALLSPSR